MTYQIIPGILREHEQSFAKDFAAAQAFAERIQIDIVDGKFAPTKTVDYTILQKFHSKVPVEIDLMVVDPDAQIKNYTLPFVDQMVIHAETSIDLQKTIDLVHEQGLRCAVAFDPNTEATELTNYKYFDQITFMSVHSGSQGQPFQETVLHKIQEARKTWPDFDIEVDGAITDETLPWVIRSGANKFVIGSFIFWHDDPVVQYNKLKQLLPVA